MPSSEDAGALDEYTITGIKTTVPVDPAIMRNGEFRAGNYDTAFTRRVMSSGKLDLTSRPIGCASKLVPRTFCISSQSSRSVHRSLARTLLLGTVYHLMNRSNRRDEMFGDPLWAKSTSMFVILSKITNQIEKAIFPVMLHGKFTCDETENSILTEDFPTLTVSVAMISETSGHFRRVLGLGFRSSGERGRHDWRGHSRTPGAGRGTTPRAKRCSFFMDCCRAVHAALRELSSWHHAATSR